MGIAAADLRQNLANFPQIPELRAARHVGLFGEMPAAITAQAEPGPPGTQRA